MDNIILLFGGNSCERDISIITAVQLYENIDKSVHNVMPIYLYNDAMYWIKNMNIDTLMNYSPKSHDEVIIYNGGMYTKRRWIGYKVIKISNAIIACHGGDGENGNLQGMLSMKNIAYSSSDSMASSILMDKCTTKHILKALNIPHLDYMILNKGEDIVYENIVNKLGIPIVVKPANLGSSIGITFINSIEELEQAIELAFSYDNKVLLEKGLTDFLEYNIAIYRKNGGLILSEIERPLASNDILSFGDKYLDDGKINGGYRELPANISQKIRSQIEKYSKKVYSSLGMKGVARFDFMVKDNKVYLNEVNTIPGSMAYYLFEEKGISYSELIEDMLRESITIKERNSNLIKYYESSVLKLAKNCGNKLRK